MIDLMVLQSCLLLRASRILRVPIKCPLYASMLLILVILTELLTAYLQMLRIRISSLVISHRILGTGAADLNLARQDAF
jgi:hypothetical protein